MTESTAQQPDARGWQQVSALIVLGAAALMLLGALLIILILGANTAEILGLARQYLFRNALKNTLFVAAVAIALGLLIAWLTAWAANGRFGILLRWSVLLPLVMPVALVALAWRMFFFPTNGWLQHPQIALLLFGMIAAWRATPFLIFAVLTLRRGVPLWIGVSGIAAYVAISDVTTPLLVTGGQPFNATHTLASWTYQLAAVNDAWAESAAAALVWLGLLSLPIAAILIALHRVRTAPTSDPSDPGEARPSSSSRVIMLLITFWLLIPMLILLIGEIGWPQAIGPLVRNTGYLQWWLNTIVLIIMTGAVAVPTATFSGVWLTSDRQHWRALIAPAALTLALLSWPVIFIPVGWLADQRAIHPEWLLWLAFSAIATCIAVWLATRASQRGRPELAMRVALAAACFVVWHDLTLTLIVRQPLAAQAISPATVSALGGSAAINNTLLTAAILFTTLVAWLITGSSARARKS